MVGSAVGGGGGGRGGGGERGKDAVGMMALHEALRTICRNSDWTYSVFWTIRPRPRVRGGNGCKVGDDNGSLMLMWEDGFCRGRVGDCVADVEGEDPVRKAFSKMSIQLYNYGEGLMGKVASDKCHKWVFKEPNESEPNISNYWQSSFDAIPPEWTDQFESGIQTIAVIQAGHGLLQLGSCKIIPEDLHFVLRMRHTFESLGYQSGFYLTQLFSSNGTSSPLSSIPAKPFTVPCQQPQPPLFNWAARPTLMLPSPSFQNPVAGLHGFPQDSNKDETHLFLQLPESHDSRGTKNMMGEHEHDIKWPSGLSFFNALTDRRDEANRLLLNPESPQDRPDHHQSSCGHHHHHNHQHPMNLEGEDFDLNPNRFLSSDTHPKMKNKTKRSYTLPTIMDSSPSSTSLNQPTEFRNSGAGLYPDIMETLLR